MMASKTGVMVNPSQISNGKLQAKVSNMFGPLQKSITMGALYYTKTKVL
jgi:hypothetical protein